MLLLNYVNKILQIKFLFGHFVKTYAQYVRLCNEIKIFTKSNLYNIAMQ